MLKLSCPETQAAVEPSVDQLMVVADFAQARAFATQLTRLHDTGYPLVGQCLLFCSG